MQPELLDIAQNMRVRQVRLHVAAHLEEQVHRIVQRFALVFHAGFEHDIFGKEIEFAHQQAVHALDNFGFPREGICSALLVFGKAYQRKPALANFHCLREEDFFTFREAYTARDALPRNAFDSGDKQVPTAGIHHHRAFRKRLVIEHLAHERLYLRRLGIVGIQVYVQDFGTVGNLPVPESNGIGKVPFAKDFRELGRFLPVEHVTHANAIPRTCYRHGRKPAQQHVVPAGRDSAGAATLERLHHELERLGRGFLAATHDVHEARIGIAPEFLCAALHGIAVVGFHALERNIHHHAHAYRGALNFFQQCLQVARVLTRRKPDTEYRETAHGMLQRPCGKACQRACTRFGNFARNHYGHKFLAFGTHLEYGVQGRLHVQQVTERIQQQYVGIPVQKATHHLAVGIDQFTEAHIRGIFRRSHHARDILAFERLAQLACFAL